MTSQVKIVQKKQGRWLWPILGIVLAIACTAIAYQVAPFVIEWAQKTFKFSRADTGQGKESLRVIFTVGVAVIFLMVAFVITAVGGRRKKPTDVNNKTLEKERASMLADKAARKKLQRKMNQKMRDHVKNNQNS